MHGRYAEKALRRVRAVAAAALCLNQHGVGAGGLPHHGGDIRRPRAGVAVRGRRRGLRHVRDGGRHVGVGGGEGELHGGGVWTHLRGEV